MVVIIWDHWFFIFTRTVYSVFHMSALYLYSGPCHLPMYSSVSVSKQLILQPSFSKQFLSIKEGPSTCSNFLHILHYLFGPEAWN